MEISIAQEMVREMAWEMPQGMAQGEGTWGFGSGNDAVLSLNTWLRMIYTVYKPSMSQHVQFLHFSIFSFLQEM